MQLTIDEQKKYNQQRPAGATQTPCWAPAKSMYIGLRGNVTSCCYNRMYTIGSYPAQSLHEIWFGEKRKRLGQAISNNDFSLGCQGCKELISAGNYSGLAAKNFDFLPLGDEGYPTKIDFELSNECNLECVMCRGEFSSAIRRNREQLPAISMPYDTAFVRQLEEFIPYLKTSHFLGGEPFMIPLYLQIWETISRLNPSVKLSIQTNGTVLTDRIKKILESMDFDISVSIDSTNRENYERIRKNAKYDVVMSNIDYLHNYCARKNTRFNFAYCPMTINWHDIPDMIAFANRLQTEVFFTTVDYPKHLSFGSLNYGELEQIEQSLLGSFYARDSTVATKNANAVQQLISHINYQKKLAMNRQNKKASNIEEYLHGLSDYLDVQKVIDKSEVLANIQLKLYYLIGIAEENNLAMQAEAKIIEVDYKTIYEAVPNVDKEHLLHLFRSFVMPIRE